MPILQKVSFSFIVVVLVVLLFLFYFVFYLRFFLSGLQAFEVYISEVFYIFCFLVEGSFACLAIYFIVVFFFFFFIIVVLYS